MVVRHLSVMGIIQISWGSARDTRKAAPSSLFKRGLNGLLRRPRPRRGKLQQVRLELEVRFGFGELGAISSTLQAFPRVFIHDGPRSTDVTYGQSRTWQRVRHSS